jgi:hypothetical protein
MTIEMLADRLAVLIHEAQEAGLDDDDIETELADAIALLKGE